MKTKHTPGPWLTIADRDEIVIYAKSGPHGDDPICFTSNSRSLEEIQANANLVSSSPELIEALQRIAEQARTFLQSDSFGLIKKKDFEKNAKNRLGAIIETAEVIINKTIL